MSGAAASAAAGGAPGWLRRFLIPTVIVAAGTAIGFWVQAKQIDQYTANRIREINAQLDADELAEKRAMQDRHTPKGMPSQVKKN